MPDVDLREFERRWRASGAPKDEAAYLNKRVQEGQLEQWRLIQMALLGDSAAQIAESVSAADIPQSAREFLGNILQHDQEARVTLTHYGLVDVGDEQPPEPAIALKLLFDDLKNNPTHIEAISQMQKPVFQLIPVYEPEGAGFHRMADSLNTRRRDEQVRSHVDGSLRLRWGMGENVRGKIVRWQLAVTEGVKTLAKETNPYRHQYLEEQLISWQQDCERRGIHLCDKRSYALLQMQELRQADDSVAIGQLGIDPQGYTVIEDPTRPPGPLVPAGAWFSPKVSFTVVSPGSEVDLICFRPSVVVDVPRSA